jgi:MacB-like periplasmic core domain
MNLKPLAIATCCLLALSAVACEGVLSPKKEEPSWEQNILAAEIRLPGAGQPVVARLSELLDRARAVPGVQAVAVVDNLPGPAARRRILHGVRHESAPAPTASLVQGISTGYFVTMGIGLIVGRPFAESDSATSTPVAIVSETYAKKNWPGESPLGKRLNIHAAGPWSTIVGVVQDGPNTEGLPEVYIPYTQYGMHRQYIQVFNWFLLARVAEDPKAVAPGLQQAVGQEVWGLREWLKSRKPE